MKRWEKHWEVERICNDDIRDKRKAGSGSFHKRGKGVKHGMSGALKTPSYYMSNKEKKKLNGEVEITNMYETLIPFKEFNLKDVETQKVLLTKWREIHDNLTIRKGLGISNKAFYDLVAELGIPRKNRVDSEGSKRKPKQAKVSIMPKKSLMETVEFLGVEREVLEVKKEVAKEIEKAEKSEKENTPVLVTTGMQLTYNKIYGEQELNNIFTKCQIMVEGENKKFHLTLSLTEIVEG
jgi:hypothetical protein